MRVHCAVVVDAEVEHRDTAELPMLHSHRILMALRLSRSVCDGWKPAQRQRFKGFSRGWLRMPARRGRRRQGWAWNPHIRRNSHPATTERRVDQERTPRILIAYQAYNGWVCFCTAVRFQHSLPASIDSWHHVGTQRESLYHGSLGDITQ